MASIKAISIESQEIIRRLEKQLTPNGDKFAIIPYEELNALAMGDVQHEKYFALTTARKHMLREHNAVFEIVESKGIKLLTDVEVIQLPDRMTGQIHRLSTKTLKKLSTVSFDKLSPKEQTKHNAQFSAFGVLAHVTKPSQIKVIEAGIEKKKARLELKETLELFK